MANTLVDGTRLSQALQRTKAYIDKKTSASSSGGGRPWLELNYPGPLDEDIYNIKPGGDLEIRTQNLIPYNEDLSKYCGIRLEDSDGYVWYAPWGYIPDDRSEYNTSPFDFSGSGRYMAICVIGDNLIFSNRTPQPVCADDLYLPFRVQSSGFDLAAALKGAGAQLQVPYVGHSKTPLSDYMGIELADDKPNYYRINFTVTDEDGSHARCDCFPCVGRLWIVEHTPTSNSGGTITFKRFL